MNVAEWVGVAFFIIKNIPEAVHSLESLLDKVHGYPGTASAAKKDISAAIESGDHSTVQPTIDDWDQKCQLGIGVGCPTSLNKG